MHLHTIFKANKPIIAMLHLEELEGPNFQGIDYLVSRALQDIKALQDGGIDGILIENWKEKSLGEFVSSQTSKNLDKVLFQIIPHIKIPFGINILNNDYKVALTLAKHFHASFIELDVFVDHVVSDFQYNHDVSKHPFEINPNPGAIHQYARQIGAHDIPIFAFIQPKHYKLLDTQKTIEQSAREAVAAGAFALLVTRATGLAPTVESLQRAKIAAPNTPVGIGSGFSIDNAADFWPYIDFAIVGTSLKIDSITDNPVDPQKINNLVKSVNALRN